MSHVLYNRRYSTASGYGHQNIEVFINIPRADSDAETQALRKNVHTTVDWAATIATDQVRKKRITGELPANDKVAEEVYHAKVVRTVYDKHAFWLSSTVHSSVTMATILPRSDFNVDSLISNFIAINPADVLLPIGKEFIRKTGKNIRRDCPSHPDTHVSYTVTYFRYDEKAQNIQASLQIVEMRLKATHDLQEVFDMGQSTLDPHWALAQIGHVPGHPPQRRRGKTESTHTAKGGTNEGGSRKLQKHNHLKGWKVKEKIRSSRRIPDSQEDITEEVCRSEKAQGDQVQSTKAKIQPTQVQIDNTDGNQDGKPPNHSSLAQLHRAQEVVIEEAQDQNFGSEGTNPEGSIQESSGPKRDSIGSRGPSPTTVERQESFSDGVGSGVLSPAPDERGVTQTVQVRGLAHNPNGENTPTRTDKIPDLSREDQSHSASARLSLPQSCQVQAHHDHSNRRYSIFKKVLPWQKKTPRVIQRIKVEPVFTVVQYDFNNSTFKLMELALQDTLDRIAREEVQVSVL